MPMTFSTTRILIDDDSRHWPLGLATARPAAAQDAARKARRSTPRRNARCATPSPAKGSKANPLDGVGAKLSADDIRQWITHPTEAAAKAKSTKKPPMPNKYGSLPAADLDALVAYMQSLK